MFRDFFMIDSLPLGKIAAFTGGESMDNSQTEIERRAAERRADSDRRTNDERRADAARADSSDRRQANRRSGEDQRK